VKAKYVALDCEMVGIGSSGKKSALARCCLVDFDGNKLYDQFVRPKSFVTDFRTKWSGVRKSDLREGVAVTLEEVRRHLTSHPLAESLMRS
jgi:RNA exonuclease 4